jgi:hypothetical protein
VLVWTGGAGSGAEPTGRGQLCRDLGDLGHAIAALELCIDMVDALGWGPATAAAAPGRSATESLSDELARLRASQTE